jgi:hypothetical protein
LKHSFITHKVSICITAFIICLGYNNSFAADIVQLKQGPSPEIIAVDGKAKLLYGNFIRKQLQKRHPTLKTIVVGDKRYMFITEKWFKDVIDWTEYFITQQVPEIGQLEKQPVAYESTFIMLMSNIANIAVAKRYNVKGSVLIGLVVAKSEQPWGAIKADGENRQYIIGLTENGSMIYHIPTRQIIAGKKFPNIKYMSGIIF